MIFRISLKRGEYNRFKKHQKHNLVFVNSVVPEQKERLDLFSRGSLDSTSFEIKQVRTLSGKMHLVQLKQKDFSALK